MSIVTVTVESEIGKTVRKSNKSQNPIVTKSNKHCSKYDSLRFDAKHLQYWKGHKVPKRSLFLFFVSFFSLVIWRNIRKLLSLDHFIVSQGWQFTLWVSRHCHFSHCAGLKNERTIKSNWRLSSEQIIQCTIQCVPRIAFHNCNAFRGKGHWLWICLSCWNK